MFERVLHYAPVYEASRRLIGAEREMRRLVEDVVGPTNGLRLLDVGCGNGRLVRFVEGSEYVGIDHNEAYIASATRLHGSDSVTFMCGDLGSFPDAAIGEFDVAVALGVLHHLDDETARSAVSAAMARLRPGGRLVTMDPCFEPSQSAVARVLMALDRGKYVRHPSDYRRLLPPDAEQSRAEVWTDVYVFPYTHFVTESSVSR